MRVRKRYFIILGLIIWGPGIVCGQRTPLFPEYDHNPLIVNPAYAGMTSGSVTSLSHNRYINNMEGAPQSSSLSHHSPLLDGKMGLGAIITNEKIGVTASTSAVAAYSYKLLFGTKRNRSSWNTYAHVFSFGITAGFQRIRDNLLELGVEDDPEFAKNLTETSLVIGAGFLYNKNDFFIGASVPNLLEERAAYGYAGYRFFADQSESVFLKPSALVKYEKGAPVQIDINLAATLNDKVEIGTGYRSTSSLNFLAGVYPIEQLRVIYYYNLGLQNEVLGNNHGIIASFAFGYD
ncbi:type IX secretion system PorP/SprF family membrane protein [Anseongella ginsenosidimutans]|uniref:Type IX secretion system PorP/SprF family membrane protein n=1 Tax=Anseongella ginsenosidimutans TaxID=496056 RepID=A0A4R3KPA6_9SPHI|nr:PorP/SprF family type IX secretion system membrane protein [Anseongella ginsenosidimutans]QEC51910.1 type IX secretion system membrane protein PorP/SprF [Anseongella ginsenosidimutans]TCS85066.1 type IX secretion system PorP/SprF family membrane protein [Anseongella ginsenosidimutans]